MKTILCKKDKDTTFGLIVENESGKPLFGSIIWSKDRQTKTGRDLCRVINGIDKNPLLLEITASFKQEGEYKLFFWCGRVHPQDYVGSVKITVNFEKPWWQQLWNWLSSLKI